MQWPILKRRQRLGFYDLLTEQAKVVYGAVDALCDYCGEPSVENARRVKDMEREADEARGRLVDEINRTFITPIDREDLFRLSTSIDDLADYAWTTIKDLRIYKAEPDRNLLSMAHILRDMAQGLVVCVENLGGDHAAVAEEARKVKKLENKLNVRFHKSMADLFEQDDLKAIFKLREIYAHLNHASDKGDYCADILQDIVVKL
ncbi:MAG: DUF47 family protein [Propionibacteriaceae bacterium]|jgi:predicted phosphate transport protein (TIGR00153 family)|nr:DUF47 family protein [Propionibacteriaceae bacterium]